MHALKPTPNMVEKIAQNPQLLSGGRSAVDMESQHSLTVALTLPPYA